MPHHALPPAVVGSSSVVAHRRGGVGRDAVNDDPDALRRGDSGESSDSVAAEGGEGRGLGSATGNIDSGPLARGSEGPGSPSSGSPTPGSAPSESQGPDCAAFTASWDGLGPWVEAPPRGFSGAGIWGSAIEWLRTPSRLWPWRGLFAAWVARSLSARFRGTRLGPLWPVIQPLFLFGVYGWLFTRLFAPELRGGSAELSIGAWIFFGAVVWTALSEGVLRATTSLAEQPDLVGRGAFPSELLPLAAVAVAGIEGAVGLCVYLLGAAFTPWAPWPRPDLWMLLGTGLASAGLVSGLALACSALQPRWRDLRPLLGVLLTAGLFASPVFWVPDPDLMPGLAPWRDALAWSPSVAFVESWRHALFASLPEGATVLDRGRAFVLLGSYGCVAFLAGGLVFRMRAHRLVDEV